MDNRGDELLPPAPGMEESDNDRKLRESATLMAQMRERLRAMDSHRSVDGIAAVRASAVAASSTILPPPPPSHDMERSSVPEDGNEHGHSSSLSNSLTVGDKTPAEVLHEKTLTYKRILR